MNPIRYAFLAALLVPTALWLLADGFFPEPLNTFTFRSAFLQYTGIVGIGAMSMAMLLALRPKWLEPWLDGLDKMYRLHKWLGVTGLVFSVVHWWWAQGTKWMVGWGWLTRPPRRPPGAGELGAVEAWLRSQRGLAETIGEWAFYAAVVLIVLALVRRFPYHLFARTHKLLAVVYLALAWHSLVLARATYWSQPVGWLLAVLLAGGSVAAIWSLAGRIGARRRVGGTIVELDYHEQMRVLEVLIVLDEGWPGHAAGQFAFATSDRREGAHPYTIASAWDPATRRIRFIAKALGDHTSRLHRRLKAGMRVSVEGPYGCFDFNDAQPRQIWIGAGIGITPFVARMKQLAATPEERPVDLFHPTREISPEVSAKLAGDVAGARVRLHLMVDGQDGPLDGERIRAVVPEWRSASLWFCGPAAFGRALRADFIARGLPAACFHQELFEMR
ncbi:ferric reductase-like transmembrane domain-containing protein [Accumulibacter sp.]|uniref:ferredoxin reductase family protein n=1 Tax=Accumulibacter sp. TaxID=2053492 RepID=UPI0025CC0681|nr:ferric reductase-like transmembrane domain-containing protein [Accumulibacter sp.]MCM8594887.1 ferric reductase-like transmembrane domain-containing protein [Accumulibacter sp.]MCM8627829.1 ferric reductase-like transmembrane domain-containing protein [Accumulibacter sp.]MDS4049033.1 ferric reductase-like transmembrane domain-containing protein [Accumulibacter sp.]